MLPITAHLFAEQSQTFATGVIVCTAHAAKGLDFDQVVVRDAAAGSYHSPMDRNLPYVACTRAMHRLVLTHTGGVSPFLRSQ